MIKTLGVKNQKYKLCSISKTLRLLPKKLKKIRKKINVIEIEDKSFKKCLLLLLESI